MIMKNQAHVPFTCPLAVIPDGPAALCTVHPRDALNLLRSPVPKRPHHSCLRPLHRAMPATPSPRPAHGRILYPVALPLENPAHA